ncbi:MAG: DUF3422 domain-containing protein [Alphaproteobacteria bacterium]|nr:DUF3422 domain-containing protein [Alphaproteobacteria bacterium]
MTGLTEHPQRRLLSQEIHARPSEPLLTPERASHLAFLSGESAQEAERAALIELCAHFGAAPPAIGATVLSVDLGRLRVRWERHTEFSTYTFFERAAFKHPFAATAIESVPADLLRQLPGQLMVAAHVAFERRRPYAPDRPPGDFAQVVRAFGHDDLAGAQVAGGAAEAFTDFQISEEGFSRFLVLDRGLTGRQAGRLARRLLEIETYRVMAVLGLPLAREAGPRVTQLDRRLADLIGRLSLAAQADEEPLLRALTELAAEVERISAETNYRFGAGRAYHDVMLRRIGELREVRIQGLPPFSEILERRLAPAIATCQSVEARIESLSVRVSRASQLLRTRVDIAVEAQNRDLLASMDKRAHLQLRLQQTVEGLSVAAITYYLVGLMGYAAKAIKAWGLPIDPDRAAGAAIPVIAAAVWLGMRHVRRRLDRH